jgi:hypothetical protein
MKQEGLRSGGATNNSLSHGHKQHGADASSRDRDASRRKRYESEHILQTAHLATVSQDQYLDLWIAVAEKVCRVIPMEKKAKDTVCPREALVLEARSLSSQRFK